MNVTNNRSSEGIAVTKIEEEQENRSENLASTQGSPRAAQQSISLSAESTNVLMRSTQTDESSKYKYPEFYRSLKAANKLYREGKHSEALQHYLTAYHLEEKPKNGHALSLLECIAVCSKLIEEFEQAIDFYTEFLEARPHKTSAVYEYAQCLQAIEEYDLALEKFSEVALIKPSLPGLMENIASVNYALGMREFEDGELDEALEYFKCAYEMREDVFEYAHALGYCLIHLGRNDEALPYLEKAYEMDSESFEAICSLGICLVNLKQHVSAEPLLRRAVKILRKEDELVPVVLFNFGKALFHQRKIEEAMEIFGEIEEMLEEGQHADELFFLIGQYHIVKSQYSWALAYLNSVAPEYVNRELYYNYLGYVCYNLEDYESAVAAFGKLKEMPIHGADGAYRVGRSLIAVDRWEDAIPFFKEAVRLDPQNVYAYSDLGRCYHMTDELHQALKAFRKAYAIKPGNFSLLRNLVRIVDEIPVRTITRKRLVDSDVGPVVETYEQDDPVDAYRKEAELRFLEKEMVYVLCKELWVRMGVEILVNMFKGQVK